MLQDLKYGFRTLKINPGFSAVAIAALALGIGANATVFSLVNGVLFKSLPFKDSDKVLYLTSLNLKTPHGPGDISLPDYQDLRTQAHAFAVLGASQRTRANLSDDATLPENYGGARVTASTFAVIGQPPLLGRAFESADEAPGAPAVIALSYNLWDKRYGKDPSIVGKTVRVNSAPVSVVAVLPRGVLFPPETEFWQPLIIAGSEKRQDRNTSVYGKLAPGYTRESAAAEIAALARSLERQYTDTNRDQGILLRSFQEISLPNQVRGIFIVLLGAVGFVLMIACANVANLLLSRAVGRSREISIRTALGAGRWRLVRQLLAESLILSAAGGLLGLAIAQWGTRAFDAAVVPTGKPSWIDFSMDYRAFAYLAFISFATSVVFGLAPALRLSRMDVNSALKDGGRAGAGIRGKYLSSALVVVEMALAVILLAGAGLMIRSFLWAYNRPLGMDPSNVLTMRFDLPQAKYPKPADQIAFHRDLLQRLHALPGVQSAAIATALPANGSPSSAYEVEGRHEADLHSTRFTVITEDYFDAFSVRPLSGHVFSPAEHAGGPAVTVVNRTLAAQAWPGKDAVGQRIRLVKANVPGPWMTVVGVVADVSPTAQRTDPDPMLYQPFRQDSSPTRFTAVIARTRVPPASLGNAFRREVQQIDRDLPVHDVSTMDDLLSLDRWPIRVFGSMFAIFAGVALLLATVGLYAVVAYGVSRRMQEIGVRVALGASQTGILKLVFASGMRQVAIGLVLGLAGAFGVTRVLSALAVGVSPTDPVTFGVVAFVLVSAAALGCAVPARRAMRVDPAIALRHE